MDGGRSYSAWSRRCRQLLAGLGLLAVPVTLATEPQDGNPFQVCVSAYALCTSAPCVSIPVYDGLGNPVKPTESLCECEVAYGVNVGPGDCALRKPQAGPISTSLMSAYSFDQAASFKVLSCSAEEDSFTDCYGKPCYIVHGEPTRARCACPITSLEEGQWVTFGGDCDSDSCWKVLWSGATVETFEAGNKVLEEYLGLPVDGQTPTRLCTQD